MASSEARSPQISNTIHSSLSPKSCGPRGRRLYLDLFYSIHSCQAMPLTNSDPRCLPRVVLVGQALLLVRCDFTTTGKSACPTQQRDPLSPHCDPAEFGNAVYSTSARHKPWGGIVGPDFERSRISKRFAISSGWNFPRPTSTNVPAIFRTIYRRKDFPRTV